MPTIGVPNTSTSGMKPISARPMPAKEPSRPACGTTFCTHAPKKEKISLKMPMKIMVAMPMYHVIIAASCSGMPEPFIARNAGPSTASATPMVEGASRPSGIAVTFGFLVFLARRNAIQV
jgi:hypothetical protein